MVSKPLVNVLYLVKGDKVAMGYLYEAMDRAKILLTDLIIWARVPVDVKNT
jgi:hypothetical protein